ncbi:hypothetical protein DL764_005811 [Monosporascus ibericus]|uniref:Glutaredoxin domain-containing protein n=1 Tax=Monosporascus ibericus TaxID=155417 RepID=A0A4Q4T9F7_9PEZI|nr:hypothetical protein DL764_005811 [Monosporascus ibericus]
MSSPARPGPPPTKTTANALARLALHFNFRPASYPYTPVMPSTRRLRLLMMAVLAMVATILFFTSKMRQDAPRDTGTIQDFYHRTTNAIDRQLAGEQAVVGGKGSTSDPHVKDRDGDGSVDEDDEQLARDMTDRLRAAEQRAKDLANQKAPLKPDSPERIVGVGSSASGQNKKGKSRADPAQDEDDETEANLEIDTTLDEIFKKSPVVIFSKTFCPYSKRAKGVLLEKYSIDPAPYVVELDEHPLGAKIQARLGDLTGRKTVPNVMINQKSIGGGDEVAELDRRKTLIDKFKSMGGTRFTMKERFVDKSKDI